MSPIEVSAELLAILRCPRCRGELSARPAALACPRCRLAFAVRDGVPNFLLEDAQPDAELRGGQPGGGHR